MRPNEWTFFVGKNEIPENGFFAITITDDVLDPDCWPIHNLIIVTGIVVKQVPIYTSAVYKIPNMEGWTSRQVAEWTQNEPGNSHPQQGYNIMWITP